MLYSERESPRVDLQEAYRSIQEFFEVLVTVVLSLNSGTLCRTPRPFGGLHPFPYNIAEDLPAPLGLRSNTQARRPFRGLLCMPSEGHHAALSLGTALFPQKSNSSRNTFLARTLGHGRFPLGPPPSSTGDI